MQQCHVNVITSGNKETLGLVLKEIICDFASYARRLGRYDYMHSTCVRTGQQLQGTLRPYSCVQKQSPLQWLPPHEEKGGSVPARLAFLITLKTAEKKSSNFQDFSKTCNDKNSKYISLLPLMTDLSNATHSPKGEFCYSRLSSEGRVLLFEVFLEQLFYSYSIVFQRWGICR